ncbi:hypothetical protein PR202_gb25599 [Eleusine coracana subsp. coracana]|uniref:Serpin domain-containing protein n=1 Tax=Eleusine coracana subsp. coracana TaxID=191504 RepID=A0AAV5FPN3_ELECO|nr:hypothetical protein PR202_gb25599 [Eleusine coracana subsp. coracana]
MAEEAKQNDAATIACQAGQAALAARLLKRISAVTADKDQNLVFSPLSIHVALALMSTAAAGDTLTEILAVAGGARGVCQGQGRGPRPRRPIRCRRAQHLINAWVAEATRNLITEILDPNDPNPDTDTADREFRRLDGTSVDVPFLQSWDSKLIACHDGFKVLKLPYETVNNQNWRLRCSQPQFSMCVFLPNGRNVLRSVVEKIASSPTFLHDRLPNEYVPVGEFRLPKFKLAFETELVPDLESLGLRLPFGGDANMSNMLMGDGAGGINSPRRRRAMLNSAFGFQMPPPPQKEWPRYGEFPLSTCPDCPRPDPLKRLTCVRSRMGNVGREFVKCESKLFKGKDGKILGMEFGKGWLLL